MTQKDMKSRIDSLWLEFFAGGITNPITTIEQISFLIFARLLDIAENRNERKSQRTGKEMERRYFAENEQHLRWSQFKNLGGAEMLPLVRDEVFRHFKAVDQYGSFMKDAQLMIQKPQLLVQAVNMVDELPLTSGGDHKGDLYEYMLSKLSTAGIAGQFRTPRHIIKKMVELVAPKPMEKVCDPACGTAGFLREILSYVMKENTSENGVIPGEDAGGEGDIYTGDLLTAEERKHIHNGFLTGFDFDATMLRISAMNMLLHGVETPNIFYQDTLSSNFSERQPKYRKDAFDVILANPPFKGNLDYDSVDPTLIKKVKTKKTELLFVVLILQMLKKGGRAAVIVPDGVLFGSSKAHLALRQMLVDENQLEAVISLPGGVFRPYATVSTGVLVFSKGGRSEDVFFSKIFNDGKSLDDKREPIDLNDLPGMIESWKNKDELGGQDRSGSCFVVKSDEVRENNYNLDVSWYREEKYIVDDMRVARDILSDIDTNVINLRSLVRSLGE